MTAPDEGVKKCPECHWPMEIEYIALGEWWYLCPNPHCWHEGEPTGQGGTES